LRGIVNGWVATLIPRFQSTEIIDALRACGGTTLEPFTLGDDDEEIATMLLRIAFSDAFGQTRFRIVSRETLGSDGGCVMTNNLEHYYVERYARGKRRKTPSAYWSFSPRNLPIKAINALGASAREASRLMNSLQVSLVADDSGFRVQLKNVDLSTLQWPETARLAGSLQKHSVIGASRETLDAIGLRVQVGKGTLSLLPGSPEATMRMTAHMLSESLLVLEPGAENEGRFKVYVRLAPPSDGEQPLKALVAVTNGFFKEWLDLDTEQAPELSESQRLTIARWLMPHDSWVDPRFLEVV